MATQASFLSLNEAAQRIRSRELSAVELVESCLQTIDQVEPGIKAWVTLDREGAFRKAKLLDDEARNDRFRGVLHGVPFGVKDIFYTAGMRTTAGHAPMADFVPKYDSAVVERLRAAGAIILGKTTTTEFALMAPTPTRNPWNPQHTPGGSSSGSAAAVASRMCPGAIGSQTVGSTLRPAAYCGVVGFKATYGRISAFGMIPLAYSLDHPGIIARQVNDLAPTLQALAGYDPRDHTSAPGPVDDYMKDLAPVEQPLIALMTGGFMEKAADEIRTNLRAAAERFARAGARIEEVTPPQSFGEVGQAVWIILTTEAAAYHREALEQRPASFDPKTLEFLNKGLLTPAVKYLHSLEVQRNFRRDIAMLLHRYDAILVPATPSVAPVGLDSTGDPIFNGPWSMTGNPAIALPSALNSEGLPMAVQLVGAAFGERRLLALARWCERELGFDQIPALDGHAWSPVRS